MTVECKLCREIVDEESYLKLHNLFSCAQRRYECSKCEMKFVKLSHRDRHLHSHGNLEYLCTFEGCNVDFWTKEFLREHQRIKGHIKRKIPESFGGADETGKSSNAIILEKYFSSDRRHACILCDLRFNYLETLKYHIKRHKDFMFECQTCGFKYRRKEILEEHERRAHQSASPCKKPKIDEKKNFALSMQKVDVDAYFSPDRPFPCTLCDLRFNHSLTLKDHLEKHSNYSFKCGTCGNKYRSEEILSAHQRIKNHLPKSCEQLIGGPSISNKITTKIIPQNSNKQSIEAYFSPDRPFPCTLCDLRFNHLQTLKDHFNRHDQLKHKCQTCGNKYRRQKVLNQHQLRAHGRKLKPLRIFKCRRYNLKYDKKQDLKNHSNILPNSRNRNDISKLFSPNRPYACCYCDVRYKCKVSLDYHLRRHPTFKYKCNIDDCGMAYWREDILKEHQKRAHKRSNDDIYEFVDDLQNESVKTKNSRKFKCHKCDARYKRRLNLRIHLKKVHNFVRQPLHWLNVPDLFSMKRPYACSECDVRFNLRNGLAQHRRKHAFFKFMCEVEECGMKYWHELILKEHQRRAHGLGTSASTRQLELDVNQDQTKNEEKVQMKKKHQYKCTKCNLSFTRRKHFNTHLKEAHETFDFEWQSRIPKKFSLKKPFACSKCDFRFYKENVLNKHLKGHQSFKFQCNVEGCGNKYRHWEVLREHQKRAHKNFSSDENEENDSKKVEVGKDEIEPPKTLEIPRNSQALNTTKSIWMCLECDANFSDENLLSKHMQENDHF